MRYERLNEIERYILQKETVSLNDLADYFNISMNTIRRDINELINQNGRFTKVYGGVSVKKEAQVLPIEIRAARNREEKEIIGRLAATLVNDGDTIFMDSGSTVPEMIPFLAQKHNLTIVTHSLQAMYTASKYDSFRVIALGGLFNQSTFSYVGISTLEALKKFSVNKAFIAATGVSLEHGLTNTTYYEAEIKGQVVQSCDEIILMADHSKFDNSSTITFFDFKDLNVVVTDRSPDDKYMEAIKQNDILLLYEDA